MTASLGTLATAVLKPSDYAFPQKSPALPAGAHGIASISHGGKTFRFRTNPNEFHWDYTLNKRIDPTYGGRVVQLLGTKIDNFSIKADGGGGRWDYINRMATFLRDVMVDQRDGSPCTFEYTTRGWKLNCYIVSIPFSDSVGEVLREFEIEMKVQEDVSSLMTKHSLSIELSRLMDGIGFRRTRYNDPTLQGQTMGDVVGDNAGATPLADLAADGIQGLQTISQYLPKGLAPIGGILNPGTGK